MAYVRAMKDERKETKMDLKHITREFQGWTKAEQGRHLREDHGIEISDEEITRRQTGRMPTAASLYQRHVTAHAEEV